MHGSLYHRVEHGRKSFATYRLFVYFLKVIKICDLNMNEYKEEGVLPNKDADEFCMY